MSRHYESNNITHDIINLSAVELRELYGIEFYENPDKKYGPVFDPVSKKEFASVQDWVADQVQQEQWENLSQTGSDGWLDDEDFY